MDLGVKSPRYFQRKVGAGAAVANLGSKVKYDRESYPLPMTMRGGVDLDLRKGLIAAFDLVAPKGEDVHLDVGGGVSTLDRAGA